MSIVIRLARPADVSAIIAIYAPYVNHSNISFELVPPSEDEMARRLAQKQARFPWLVAEIAGEVTGYAYAGTFRERAAYQWSAEISVYVHNERHGGGIGRALYTALFAMLRAQGYRNVYGGITLPNAASVALHQAMGMTLVGVYRHVGYKAGSWHDVGWWEGALQPPVDDPAPPRALLDIAPATAWDSWLQHGDLTHLRELTAPQTVSRAQP
jgi:L-amino acid N-acyltransferase YncA